MSWQHSRGDGLTGVLGVPLSLDAWKRPSSRFSWNSIELVNVFDQIEISHQIGNGLIRRFGCVCLQFFGRECISLHDLSSVNFVVELSITLKEHFPCLFIPFESNVWKKMLILSSSCGTWVDRAAHALRVGEKRSGWFPYLLKSSIGLGVFLHFVLV